MLCLYWIHARTICYLLLIRREAERGDKKIINEMSRSNTQTHTSNGHNFSRFSRVYREAKQQPIYCWFAPQSGNGWMDWIPSFCLSFIPPKDLLVAEFLRWNQLGLTSSQGWSSGSEWRLGLHQCPASPHTCSTTAPRQQGRPAEQSSSTWLQ